MSDTPESGQEKPLRYRLRIQAHARRQINAESVRLVELTDPMTGYLWLEGLEAAMASLVTMPDRCLRAPEARRFGGIWRGARQFLYRRTTDGPAWRILFVIEEPDEEAPTVRVLAVRHGTRRPMTRKEALEDE